MNALGRVSPLANSLSDNELAKFPQGGFEPPQADPEGVFLGSLLVFTAPNLSFYRRIIALSIKKSTKKQKREKGIIKGNGYFFFFLFFSFHWISPTDKLP
jgi:hypothetical protein